MAATPKSGAVPPIEPTPAGPPAAVPPTTASATPPPPPPPPPVPVVDPYASSQQNAPMPPPAQPYAPAYNQAGYYAQPTPPRGLAIASMVTGIVGVFFSLFEGFGFLSSLAAVITGHLARKRQPYARGMWMTGLICGYIGLAFSLIWFAVLIIVIAIGVSTAASGGDFNY